MERPWQASWITSAGQSANASTGASGGTPWPPSWPEFWSVAREWTGTLTSITIHVHVRKRLLKEALKVRESVAGMT